MGRTLIDTYPVFKSSIYDAQVCLSSLGAGWNLVEELARPEASSRLAQPYLSFPCSVIVQLALVRLLTSWNVTPVRVTGHSSSEISAANAAGILTFEAAITFAYLRGRLTSDYVDDGHITGGMAAPGAGGSAGCGVEMGKEQLRLSSAARNPDTIPLSSAEVSI